MILGGRGGLKKRKTCIMFQTVLLPESIYRRRSNFRNLERRSILSGGKCTTHFQCFAPFKLYNKIFMNPCRRGVFFITLQTTLLQMFYENIFNSNIIIKMIITPDDNLMPSIFFWLRTPLFCLPALIINVHVSNYAFSGYECSTWHLFDI